MHGRSTDGPSFSPILVDSNMEKINKKIKKWSSLVKCWLRPRGFGTPVVNGANTGSEACKPGTSGNGKKEKGIAPSVRIYRTRRSVFRVLDRLTTVLEEQWTEEQKQCVKWAKKCIANVSKAQKKGLGSKRQRWC